MWLVVEGNDFDSHLLLLGEWVLNGIHSAEHAMIQLRIELQIIPILFDTIEQFDFDKKVGYSNIIMYHSIIFTIELLVNLDRYGYFDIGKEID